MIDRIAMPVAEHKVLCSDVWLNTTGYTVHC